MPDVEFVVSPQFEISYALATLAEPDPPVHAAWCAAARERLGGALRADVARHGLAAWLALPDVLGAARPVDDVAALLKGVRALDEGDFGRDMLTGLIHDEGVVTELMAGRSGVAEGLARLPEAKREWLVYIGLYPHRPDSPAGSLLEALASRPGAVRDGAADTLEAFWERVFADAWRRLEPQLQISTARSERLFAAATLDELVSALRLLVEIDGGDLCALRGGYRIALDALEAIYFLPSAFNRWRFWTVLPPTGPGTAAVLPYFDPAIELDPIRPRHISGGPESDPALVCKALGDATRFSLVGLLAARPRTAAELATALGLSKPTVSHHLFQLRAAGLIDERSLGKASELSVNRARLESLSGDLVARLFGHGG